MCRGEDPHILIHPRRGKREKPLSENGLLLVNPSEALPCHRRLLQEGGESRFLFNSELTVARGDNFFLAGPAIGAPMAVLCMEKCIALGAKKIILYGWCGAISPDLKTGDVLLPAQALAGEGTSQYYPLSAPAAPTVSLRGKLAVIYAERGVQVQEGCVWSTDAVYREDRRLLQDLHQRNGVVAVDMEFSALCTVARFRNIEFAAVLIVSDELWGERWRPGFSKELFLVQKEQTLVTLLESLEASLI